MYGYFTERNYNGDLPYTDLALERRRADVDTPGVEYTKEKCAVGYWERIKISSKKGAESIGRPMGLYDTLGICRVDMLDSVKIEAAKDEIAGGICRILDASEIFPGRILICGLGNPYLTPDAIGCEAAREIKPTMHIKEHSPKLFTKLSCAEIAVIAPGVAATSGLDAAVIVRGVCDIIKPDAVIAIDALAARDVGRIGSTIQICNSGISPGSGIGNPRLAIGIETVGVPVIAIGVPTVIDTRVMCGGNAIADQPMFVSPKEINDIVSSAARIIGGGINRALGIYA